MKKYEVYDCNDEVIEGYDEYTDAVTEAEYSNGKFILDTETNEVVWGSIDD